MALLAALSALLVALACFAATSAFADEGAPAGSDLADGTYKLSTTAITESSYGTEEPSEFALTRQFDPNIKLEKKGDALTVSLLYLPSGIDMQKLAIDDQEGTKTEAGKDAEGTPAYEFTMPIADIDKDHKLTFTYDTGRPNIGNNGIMSHSVYLTNMSTAAWDDYAWRPQTVVEEGSTYTADAKYVKADSDEESMSGNYMEPKVSISKNEDGTFNVDLTLNAEGAKLEAKVLGDDGAELADVSAEDATAPTYRVVVASIKNPIPVKFSVAQMPQPQSARVVLDLNSIVKDADEEEDSTPEPAAVDKAALNEALANAQADADGMAQGKPAATQSADGKDVAPDKMWVTPEAQKALTDAIAEAGKVYADEAATQEQVDAAAAAVNDAVAAYDAAKKPGTASIWQRLAGGNAYGTMAAIAQEGWKDKSDTVIVANFDGYWDALAASSVAGKYSAPILLTDATSLSAESLDQIKRLGASMAIVVGGRGSVSDACADQVKTALTGDATVTRFAGGNAAETAVAIAAEVAEGAETCIIATSKSFHDALSVSPYAFNKKAPIYLTDDAGQLSADTLKAIKEGGYKRAIIAGGKGSVLDRTEADLKAAGVAEVQRKAGTNAIDTSVDFANFAIQEGLSANFMGVATVDTFYDALTGGPLCGKNNGVLVLASADNTTATSVPTAHKADISRAYIIGGRGPLPDSVFEAFAATTK